MINKNYSYVTVLNSAEYFEGVQTLLYSLRKVHSVYPLIVLVPRGFDEKICKELIRIGAIVEYADNIELGKYKQLNKRQYWNETFFKLNVFNMISYEKLVYIDSDMIVLKNIDELFKMPHISAVHGGKIIFGWEDINSGLMVIEPDKNEFDDMLNLIPVVCEKKIAANEGYGDQDIISYYFRNVNLKWYGERKLDERYNTMIRCAHELCVKFGYNNLKIIHFTGEKKPWMYSCFDAAKYVLYYTLHHERYRAMCGLKYFWYVFCAKIKY